MTKVNNMRGMSFGFFISSIAFCFAQSVLASEGFTFLGPVSEHYQIPEQVLSFSMVAGVILLLGYIYKRSILKMGIQNTVIPDEGITLRNAVEFFGQKILGLVTTILGEDLAPQYFLLAASVFILIFMSNLLGLIPGFLPPTSNINTTLALGIFVFIYYNYEGIKSVGWAKHVKHLFGPVKWLAPLMFVIELLSHCIRPISLALRLRSNMEGDHMLLSLFTSMTKVGIPVIFMGLGTFVSFIQAFVFTILSLVYVKLSIESHDHDDH